MRALTEWGGIITPFSGGQIIILDTRSEKTGWRNAVNIFLAIPMTTESRQKTKRIAEKRRPNEKDRINFTVIGHCRLFRRWIFLRWESRPAKICLPDVYLQQRM
jgi:hypothetical protein